MQNNLLKKIVNQIEKEHIRNEKLDFIFQN
jgi:hypothetical protein